VEDPKDAIGPENIRDDKERIRHPHNNLPSATEDPVGDNVWVALAHQKQHQPCYEHIASKPANRHKKRRAKLDGLLLAPFNNEDQHGPRKDGIGQQQAQ